MQRAIDVSWFTYDYGLDFDDELMWELIVHQLKALQITAKYTNIYRRDGRRLSVNKTPMIRYPRGEKAQL